MFFSVKTIGLFDNISKFEWWATKQEHFSVVSSYIRFIHILLLFYTLKVIVSFFSAGCYLFKEFLESEIADENLKFWLACEDLKNSKQKRIEKRILDIYETYIDVYSPHEVRICKSRTSKSTHINNLII